MVLAFFLVLPAATPVLSWDKIISFGDSLSDDGNGGANNFPGIIPEGMTGPSSDGPVWLTYLADTMTAGELEGRAIGGARTSGPVWDGGLDIGMEAQVDRYVTIFREQDLSNTLFTIWIGGNDLLLPLWKLYADQGAGVPIDAAYLRTFSFMLFAIIGPAIDSFEASTQKLIDAGAQDILVMTMPDLGLAPAITSAGSTVAEVYTVISDYYNQLLLEKVCALRSQNQGKLVQFYVADTFKLLQFAVDNAAELGFENTMYPCSDTGMDCSVSIFYDGIHPTTHTHQYLAALALGQVKHGSVSPDLNAMLMKLVSLNPRMPFVCQ